jgi:mono/diheme cytochrome c family protein
MEAGSVPLRPWRIAITTLIATAACVLAGGFVVVVAGLYDVGAISQHTRPVYWLLDRALHQSVRVRAMTIDTPALDSPGLRERGLQCFHRHCTSCHGAPGLAPERHALAVQPVPRPLTNALSEWQPRELFWIARNGIRMSGMPAWHGRLEDEDLWAIVAFLQELPTLAPTAYRARAAHVRADCDEQPALAAGLAEAGAVEVRHDALDTFRRYGCHGCHAIPGIVGPAVTLGPPLAGFGRRALVAGRWPNSEDQVAAWIRKPQDLDPRSAMPDLGVSEQDALMMARHLRSLR